MIVMGIVTWLAIGFAAVVAGFRGASGRRVLEERCASETLVELMIAHTDADDEAREEMPEWL